MLNRLVLISDGGANAGVTDIEIIAENAAYGGSDGIYLVGVGVDKNSNYNDELMDDVTDAGKGASVFLPDEDEIWDRSSGPTSRTPWPSPAATFRSS